MPYLYVVSNVGLPRAARRGPPPPRPKRRKKKKKKTDRHTTNMKTVYTSNIKFCNLKEHLSGLY